MPVGAVYARDANHRTALRCVVSGDEDSEGVVRGDEVLVPAVLGDEVLVPAVPGVEVAKEPVTMCRIPQSSSAPYCNRFSRASVHLAWSAAVRGSEGP